jgi:hypothetical protein
MDYSLPLLGLILTVASSISAYSHLPNLDPHDFYWERDSKKNSATSYSLFLHRQAQGFCPTEHIAICCTWEFLSLIGTSSWLLRNALMLQEWDLNLHLAHTLICQLLASAFRMESVFDLIESNCFSHHFWDYWCLTLFHFLNSLKLFHRDQVNICFHMRLTPYKPSPSCYLQAVISATTIKLCSYCWSSYHVSYQNYAHNGCQD